MGTMTVASAGAYRISVEIEEERKGIFDLKPDLDRGVFRELRNVHYVNDRVGSDSELKLRHYPRGASHAQ